MVILEGPMKSHRAQPSTDDNAPEAIPESITRCHAARPNRAATCLRRSNFRCAFPLTAR